MNKTKTVLAALLVTVMGAGAANVMANDGDSEGYKGKGDRGSYSHGKHHGGKHHGKRGGGEHMMRYMGKKLNLTDAQKTQVKELRETQKTQMQPLREQGREIRQEMMALDTTAADYSEKVAAIADTKANLDRQNFILKSQFRQQFEAILTDEQRATMKSMQEKHQARMQERMEKRDAKKEEKSAE